MFKGVEKPYYYSYLIDYLNSQNLQKLTFYHL